MISKIPEPFIRKFEIPINDLVFFKKEVKTPARIIIIPCPSEKRNNIIVAITMFFESAAKLIIAARMGVEQGVDASANIPPIIRGYKTMLLFLFWGICFTMTGI